MLYDCKEISKVSPNLSLRLSPERKCSPCRYPYSCTICHFSPCRCCKVCHYLPCRCVLHYSPIRCCSPCHVHTHRPCSPCAFPPRPAPCSPLRTTQTVLGSTNASYNSPPKKINDNYLKFPSFYFQSLFFDYNYLLYFSHLFSFA